MYFEGTATLLAAGDEQTLAAECITARLRPGKDVIEEATHADGHQFYKISVTNWYVFGRFDGSSGQKYQLPWRGDAGT